MFVDGEHGPFSVGDLAAALQAVPPEVACVVRVPVGDEAPIKQTLDLGATGVIVPQVNSAEHAEQIVRWSRYAPLGSRGVGLARAHGYGARFAEYLESANDRVSVIVQAEHIDAVNNIDAIAAVEGVDAVLLGPYDLSASMNKMGQVDDPDVVAAIDRVIEACKSAGKPIGMFGVSADALRPYLARGCTLICASLDALLLGNAARRIREQLS